MLKPSMPVGRVYYFELTPRSHRLIYYVPLRMLQRLVRRRVVRKEVLHDFPFGLEVEVSEAEFRLIREEYGVKPPESADLLWDAFRGFWLNSDRRLVTHFGTLDAAKVEEYAEQIRPHIEQLVLSLRRSGMPRPHPEQQSSANQAERSATVQDRIDALLRRNRPAGSNLQVPIEKLEAASVVMSAGLSPAEVFARAQFPNGQTRHGRHR
jgi:hypothetical protein